MKNLLLTLTSLLITVASFGQGHIFSILANKGTNQVKQGTSWNTAKTGSKIYKGNMLKVSSNGYLGLMHKSGKTIELKTAGEYSISDLESKIQTSSSSYAERYTKFALNLDGSEGAKYNYNVTGSVERGSGTYSLLTDDTIKVIKAIPFTMAWITDNTEDEVELRVVNLFNDKLYSVKGKSNSATINLTSTSIKSSDFYVVNLFDPNSESEEPLIKEAYNIKLIDDKASTEIVKEYNLLVKELNLNSSLDHMILASFFVEKNLSSYAASHLHQAAALSPDVKDYEGAFYQYLENEGIVTKIK